MMAADVARRRAARRRYTPHTQRLRGLRTGRRSCFTLHRRTLIRHACHPRTVTTASLGMHGATSWGCLIAAPSFPLPVAAGVLGAVSHAINLISVAPTTDQNLTSAPGANKRPARYFISTSICAYPAHENQALCVDAVHAFLALAEMAHASGRRGLWNERLRRPAYRILARARVGGKANMPPPRQAASAADRAICARIFTAIDSYRIISFV